MNLTASTQGSKDDPWWKQIWPDGGR
jgi:hypothetical protein